jgi:hypothetical protein
MSKSGRETAAITARYRAFAAEARGRSPRYEELALAAGSDQPVLAFLAALPPAKRQPNLLFAGARYRPGAARCCPPWRFLTSPGEPAWISTRWM